MMLGHEIFDPETNRRVLVDHAFIVAGGEITKQAKNWLGESSINILIVDEFCDKGGTLDDAKKYVQKAFGSRGIRIETAAIHLYKRHSHQIPPSFFVDTPEEETEGASGDREPMKP